MKKIAIFASGNGSNAEHISRYFFQKDSAEVHLILTNNPNAGVLARAEDLNISAVVFNREEFSGSDKINDLLLAAEIDFIVLAGFLWLVPLNILRAFRNKIVNIHPALLPKYGGKGMYGSRVHEAVIASGDSKSGITIHYVNEKYDDGQIIFQAEVAVKPTDTADRLAAKIHELEHAYFPVVIEEVVEKL
ncbi:MAG: phosphoribosylglycinamide formyltransferase [Bacteroidales bacterium]|nr:phosphoribosylglycinamide formyltransferase [Bacteroidales bacterium]MCF6342485.1 phosphoribosylglycinamide formyltransferase [Bacteroidales bacterium]